MDHNALIAITMSLIAGFSTVVGGLIIFFKTKNKEKIVYLALNFAAAVMLTISIIDLIPSSLDMLGKTFPTAFSLIIIIVFFFLGILITHLIHQKLDDISESKLYKVGIISMIALIIHNFPEGIATFTSSYTDISLGLPMTIAIAMHNIPEGISIALPIFYATGNAKKALGNTFLSGMAEPLGAILTFLIFKNYINDIFLGSLYAIIAGIMIYISIEELMPNAKSSNKKIINYAFFFGVLFMICIHYLT